MINESIHGDQHMHPQPTPATGRIQSLDVLKGIALLCGLFVMIWYIGGFGQQQRSNLVSNFYGGNFRLYGAVDLLINGKMRAIIAIVFGAAMVIFLTRRSLDDGLKQGDVFMRRQVALIILGVINAFIFLYSNELLYHLGVMGILVFSFVRLSPRALLITAFTLTLIYSGKLYWDYSDDKKSYRKYQKYTALAKQYHNDSVAKAKKGEKVKKDTLTKMQVQDTSAWPGRVGQMKVDVKRDEGEKKSMSAVSYWKVWNHVIPNSQWRESAWTYQKGIWDFAGMMFLGMLLYKVGFFNNNFARNKYLLIGLLALAGGLCFGWLRLHQTFFEFKDYQKYVGRNLLPANFFFPFEKAFTALGIISMVMYLLPFRFLNYFWKGFAAAGRLSLSNYIFMIFISTIFFYGYGFGYFGRLSQWQLYLFAVELIMVQVVLSVVWLKFFNYGPVEWLVRRISEGRPLPKPFRKVTTVQEPVSPVLS